MTFQEILKFAGKGESVRRKGWQRKEYRIKLDDVTSGRFINDEDNRRWPITLILADYQANDWEVYKEIKYFNFKKALKLMEDGQKVRSKAWGNIITGCLYLEGNEFCMECGNKDKKWHYYYNLKRRDLKAKDWYVVED